MKNNTFNLENFNNDLNEHNDINTYQSIFAFQQMNENFLTETYNEPNNNYSNNQDNNPVLNINEKKPTNGICIDKNNPNYLIINKNRLSINLEKLKTINCNSPAEQIKIEIKANKNKKKIKSKPGRKRKRSEDNYKNKYENQSEHNKYSDDNLRRKCKHYIIKSLLDFINSQIKIVYEGKIGNGIFKKELQTINQSQKFDATINFNKTFLEKKLKDIFSVDITGRITTFPPSHNRMLIKLLLNEKDENKRNYFKKLFNLNFMDCLRHFREEVIIEELKGLKCLNDIKNKIINSYEDGVDYFQNLKYYLNNYETIINSKKPRRRRKIDKN